MSKPQGTVPGYAAPTVIAPPVGVDYQNQDWRVGLCDCMNDGDLCCLTCWCPCITFGRIAEIVDRGSTSCGTAGTLYTLLAVFTGCQCIYGWFNRTKLRAQYNLPDSPCCDCGVHYWCHSCALCQEYKELENRGFDMTIGWQLNMERQNAARGVQMQPPMVLGMARKY